MKNTQKGFIVQGIVALLALILIAGGAYHLGKKNQTLLIAQNAVVKDLKTSAKLECLTFNGIKDQDSITYTITRTFNSKCPGDPTSAPQIPNIKIDLKTKEVYFMALDGVFRKL